MGEVYRARDLRLARDVAIKVMAAHIAADPMMRQRFETEARAVAALSHPSILSIHELGVADFRNSGSGGTGWEQNNPSLSRVNLDDRWTRDVVDPAPDMVVVAMGYNDLEDGNDVAIGAMAAAKLNELREAVPGCLVHVLGPWDSNAYASAAPDADAVSLTAALEEACEGIPGVWFHSMLGVAFEPVGGGDIHPALGGHTTIAHHGYDEIAAVHGLRPRS